MRLRQYALVVNPDLTPDDPWSPPPTSAQKLYEMFAWVEAYGSPELLVAYNKLLVAHASTRTAVAHLGEARARNHRQDRWIEGTLRISSTPSTGFGARNWN